MVLRTVPFEPLIQNTSSLTTHSPRKLASVFVDNFFQVKVGGEFLSMEDSDRTVETKQVNSNAMVIRQFLIYMSHLQLDLVGHFCHRAVIWNRFLINHEAKRTKIRCFLLLRVLWSLLFTSSLCKVWLAVNAWLRLTLPLLMISKLRR